VEHLARRLRRKDGLGVLSGERAGEGEEDNESAKAHGHLTRTGVGPVGHHRENDLILVAAGWNCQNDFRSVHENIDSLQIDDSGCFVVTYFMESSCVKETSDSLQFGSPE
jgi:hypothetical protein